MVQVMRLALALAMASGVASTAAFQQRVEPPVLSVRTELVTLTVTVVDRDGGLVTGLRSDHFAVYDNGEPRAIEFFSSEDVPATIGLIIDNSGSMRGRRAQVEAAMTAFAAGHHPLDELFALNFNEVVWPATWPGTPAQGLTALYDAIDRGLSDLQRGTRDRKALILLSDGGDNASAQSLDTVLDRARRTNAAIYSVTFFDPDNRDARPQVLKALTRETGGRAFTARTIEDVVRAVARIVQEVRSGYSIGFAPAATASGGYRSIRVAVAAGNRELIARTRAGYYAGPSRAPVN
jgi:hypothetical protein